MSRFIYKPGRTVCRGAEEDAAHNAWLDDPESMAPFYQKYPHAFPGGTDGLARRTREHVITTGPVVYPSTDARWAVPIYREQRCSCGSSWRCDAPEARAVFLLDGWHALTDRRRTGASWEGPP